MIRKSFAFILFVLIGAGVGNAQTPQPGTEKEGVAAKAFALSFDGNGGYLGVQTEEISKDNLAKYSLRDVRGVGVESVVEGSPAQSAGILKGDVILNVNGEDITSTRKLTRLMSEISPDHQARVTVLRGGSERDITVTVGKRPGIRFNEGNFTWSGPMDNFQIPRIDNMPNMPRIGAIPLPQGDRDFPTGWGFTNRRQIGVGVMALTKQLADHFGVEGGVLVNSVRENSAAARAGIKAGDVITEVDGKAVKGDIDLIRAIAEKKDGSVTLTIMRDRNRQTVTVTPEEVKGFETQFFEFSTPDAPEGFKLDRQSVPTPPETPRLLNQILIPGRVI